MRDLEEREDEGKSFDRYPHSSGGASVWMRQTSSYGESGRSVQETNEKNTNHL